MWILAIVKVLCLMPNFETIKYFEGFVHSMTQLFGMWSIFWERNSHIMGLVVCGNIETLPNF